MSRPDKRRLDRLQAEVTRRTGRKVTQEELLARLTRLGEEHLDAIAAPSRDVSEAEIQALLDVPLDLGFESREEDVDRILYGARRR